MHIRQLMALLTMRCRQRSHDQEKIHQPAKSPVLLHLRQKRNTGDFKNGDRQTTPRLEASFAIMVEMADTASLAAVGARATPGLP
jgi:hypothetical protein